MKREAKDSHCPEGTGMEGIPLWAGNWWRRKMLFSPKARISFSLTKPPAALVFTPTSSPCAGPSPLSTPAGRSRAAGQEGHRARRASLTRHSRPVRGPPRAPGAACSARGLHLPFSCPRPPANRQCLPLLSKGCTLFFFLVKTVTCTCCRESQEPRNSRA